MTDAPDAAPRFGVSGSSTDHFAWLRTRMALERTMLSWLRTAVSLIGFGFAIVQFFARLKETPHAAAARFPEAPPLLGLALIGSGILVLVVSIWQYRWTTRYLWQASFLPIAGMRKEGIRSPVLAAAFVLTFIGLFAFAAVLLRLV